MSEHSHRVVDEFDGGFGWIAHPSKSFERTSHALRTDDGLWLLDPLDAHGPDDVLAERSPGEDDDADVAGVAVCAGWHARDAATVAARHDVPVTVPALIDRPLARLDAPAGDTVEVERVEEHVPGTDVTLHRVSPMGAWTEAVCWRRDDGTLYVSESLRATETFLVGDERLGVSIYARLAPPRATLVGFDPDRVLVGHGDGVFDGASAALAYAIAGSRARFPRALLAYGPRAMANLATAVLR